MGRQNEVYSLMMDRLLDRIDRLGGCATLTQLKVTQLGIHQQVRDMLLEDCTDAGVLLRITFAGKTKPVTMYVRDDDE